MTDTNSPRTDAARSPAHTFARNAITPLIRLALAATLLTLLFRLGRDETLLNATGEGASAATRNLLISAHDFAASVGASTAAVDVAGMAAFLIVTAAVVPTSVLSLRAPQQQRWQRSVTLLGNITRPTLRWYLAFTIATALTAGQAGAHPAVLSVGGVSTVGFYTVVLAAFAYPNHAAQLAKTAATTLIRRNQNRYPEPAS
ncbi:hypothetical protein GS489_01600 [Rhodococcus hoagii]|nr:hypothetical protein [Prescottella equi]MBM4569232.1 hypothetical protein [Prescottella equi]